MYKKVHADKIFNSKYFLRKKHMHILSIGHLKKKNKTKQKHGIIKVIKRNLHTNWLP